MPDCCSNQWALISPLFSALRACGAGNSNAAQQAMETTTSSSSRWRVQHSATRSHVSSRISRKKASLLQYTFFSYIHVVHTFRWGTNIDRLVAGGKFSSCVQLNEQSNLMFHFLPNFMGLQIFSRYEFYMKFTIVTRCYVLRKITYKFPLLRTVHSIHYKI